MLEVILDTETTGLSTKEKHKIVEIGCVELSNQISTNQIFLEYKFWFQKFDFLFFLAIAKTNGRCVKKSPIP